MTVDRLAHAALLIVDMQNDFVRVGAPLEVPQARETTAANTAAAAPRRDLIHPGVAKYLQEIGLLR